MRSGVLAKVQGNRVWKSRCEEGAHRTNISALSLRSWFGFDDFRSRFDFTNPNAIALSEGEGVLEKARERGRG